MSLGILILGESGTGKSASLRNLDPKNTLLIQAVKKPLPFKAANWRTLSPGQPGNVFVSDQSATIINAMRKTPRPVIVIDDFQYILANEYMRRSEERGYDKFSDIGRHAWDVLSAANSLPGNQRVYILAHTEQTEHGKIKAKTIGKLLDEKITIEGLFSIVMRTVVQNGNYLFSTHNNGQDTVKTPMGMFADDLIDNDLAVVDAAILNYYDDEMRESPAQAIAVSEAPAVPEYSEENFVANQGKWAALIASGRQTPDSILAMLSSKARLSESQITRIRALGLKKAA
jgi:hypothetical protein